MKALEVIVDYLLDMKRVTIEDQKSYLMVKSRNKRRSSLPSLILSLTYKLPVLIAVLYAAMKLKDAYSLEGKL